MCGREEDELALNEDNGQGTANCEVEALPRITSNVARRVTFESLKYLSIPGRVDDFNVCFNCSSLSISS